MVWLLDSNVITALTIDSHVDHPRAISWFYEQRRDFATCAITEGSLLRMHMMFAADPSAAAAWATLHLLRGMSGHEFWEEGFSYEHVNHRHLTGHRQVTDAWLAELVRRRGGKLATMDQGLAQTHQDVAELLPRV